MQLSRTLKNILIAGAIAIILGLAAWYFYITAQQRAIEQQDAARGFGTPTQSFESSLGSTYENLVSNISSTFDGGTEEKTATKAPQLAQVTASPVAGANFIGSGTSTRLRFVERSSGFVFDADPQTVELTRLTNTLVPIMHEALVVENDRLIVRGLDDNGAIATFTAQIVSTSTSADLQALVLTRLPNDIKTIAAHPGGEGVFYIGEGAQGAVGIRSSWDLSEQTPVFTSALAGWNAFWLANDRIVLVQRPASGILGYAYGITSGRLSPIAYDVPGLTLLPHPTTTALLYGASSGSSLSLSAQIDSSSSAVTLPIRTIADKCVWSPAESAVAFCAVPQSPTPSSFLDLWYRGETHTADAWWRIDAKAASVELVFSPNTSVDVENPVINKNGTHIAFMNAVDKSLWLLRIAE